MMDISLGGLIGAIIGTLIAGVTYHLFIGALDRRVRERAQSQTAGERDTMDQHLALLRRIVLAVDLFVFAAVGYWIGRMIEG